MTDDQRRCDAQSEDEQIKKISRRNRSAFLQHQTQKRHLAVRVRRITTPVIISNKSFLYYIQTNGKFTYDAIFSSSGL